MKKHHLKVKIVAEGNISLKPKEKIKVVTKESWEWPNLKEWTQFKLEDLKYIKIASEKIYLKIEEEWTWVKNEEVYVKATGMSEKWKSKFLWMIGVKDFEEKAKVKADETTSNQYKEMNE